MPCLSWAQDIPETDPFGTNDLFGGDEFVVEGESQSAGILDDVLLESVGFSGGISAQFAQNITQAYLDGDGDFGDNPYHTSIDGDFLLDIRLQTGIKSFINLWGTYTPQNVEASTDTENFSTTLKEMFVDVNAARNVYFRFGKQNLKWGSGYLWNPTDLISVDRKDFGDIDSRREGVYGLKAHVPFGANMNVYGFVNATGAERLDEFAIAGKMEFVVFDDIEVAVSAWNKRDYEAVYGLDVATRKFDTNLWMELSLSDGENRHRLEIQNTEDGKTYTDVKVSDEWVPRISAGFTRFFDFGNYTDRISLTGEFYYNAKGYADDMLADEATRTRFLEGGYFESGKYGKYYAAMFARVGRFLVTDMALTMRAIGNLSDSSFMLMSGLDYEIASNARLQADVTGYFGKDNREYTLEGNAFSTNLTMNIAF